MTPSLARRTVLLALAAGAVHGCAAPPPPPTLELAITAGRDQNPVQTGAPAPVQILLLQLSETAAFTRADPFALAASPAAALGAALLGSESLIVAPGESKLLHRDVKSGAVFLGVVALFRDVDHATWRASAPLAVHGPTALRATTTRLAVTLGPAA